MTAAPVIRPNPMDQALRYLSLGFSVIPLKARDKKPAMPWKEFQGRRATEGEVREWFRNGNLNLAIVTGALSNIVVVDADSDAAVAWMRQNHDSPIRSRTGKGQHFIFSHPGYEVRNDAKLLGMALDVRADGGYIVAPGSIHPNGSVYQEEGDWTQLDELPMFNSAWLGDKVTPFTTPDTIERRVRAYLDKIPGEAEGGRDMQGFRVACKLAREFALPEDTALGYLAEWNLRNTPPMSMADIRRLVKSALKSGKASIGSKIEDSRPTGHWTPPAPAAPGESVDAGGPGSLAELLTTNKEGNPRRTPGNLAKILRLDPQWGSHLALNEMTRDVLFDGEAVPDVFVDWVQEQLEDHYMIAFGRDEVSAKVLAQASQTILHPVRDWLLALKWDGTERIHRLGLEVLGSTSDMAVHYLRCTMVGAVRRVLKPGTKMDTLTVLEGPQGLGKSSFWRHLVSPQWFGDSPLDLDSKDGMMTLHRNWCTELSEIDHATGTKAAERIKAFLSSSMDVFRPPFGRAVQVFPRSCFMVGTTNSEGFLVDPTGSRRFWPIRCSKVDIRTLRSWREQLWAEAVNLEAAGVDHWLDQSRETLREGESAEFEAQDPWDEQVDMAVASYLHIEGRSSSDGFSAADLLTRMGIPVVQQNRGAEMRLARLLKRRGWRSQLMGVRRLKRWFP